MKKQFWFLTPLCVVLLFTACQKEVSFEMKGGSASSGSLQSDVTGECLPKTVQGSYEVGKALNPDSNFINVQVNTTSPGDYHIYSDTINGVFFEANGNFENTGLNTVRLSGSGTPVNAGSHTFAIIYDSTACNVIISTLLQGGLGPAVFTFTGAPNACLNFVLTGDYVTGVALTNANTVVINVDVTVAGTYNFTSELSNGIRFTGSGSFPNTGQQTVTLTASGTPVVEGTTNIPVIFGGSNCSFVINVATAGQVVDYFPTTANSNWSYQFDDNANDSLFVRAKAGTVTLGGNDYTVLEATTDGVNFADFGNYRKAGSDYHIYTDIGGYFGFDNPQDIDYIFLKDNIPAGTGWQTEAINGAISGTPISIRIAFTIEQKDVAVTIGAASYPNTIVVIEKYEVFDGVNWIDATSVVGYYKSFYSRNIGLVKQDYYYEDGNTDPPLEYKQDIRRYEVF